MKKFNLDSNLNHLVKYDIKTKNVSEQRRTDDTIKFIENNNNKSLKLSFKTCNTNMYNNTDFTKNHLHKLVRPMTQQSNTIKDRLLTQYTEIKDKNKFHKKNNLTDTS